MGFNIGSRRHYRVKFKAHSQFALRTEALFLFLGEWYSALFLKKTFFESFLCSPSYNLLGGLNRKTHSESFFTTFWSSWMVSIISCSVYSEPEVVDPSRYSDTHIPAVVTLVTATVEQRAQWCFYGLAEFKSVFTLQHFLPNDLRTWYIHSENQVLSL